MVAERVVWPAPPRPTGGLLTVTRPMPDGWERGVTFSSTGCIEPVAPVDVCEGATKTADSKGAVATFEPHWEVLAVECSALGSGDLEQSVRDQMAGVREWIAGRALWNGVASNPDLSTNPSVSTAVAWIQVGDAIAAAVQEFSAATFGRVGVVHLPPFLGEKALQERAIWRDGGTWRTATGWPVSISPGYPLTLPDGLVIVSLPVHHAQGPVETLSDIERTQNVATVRVEELHLVAYDPCIVARESVALEVPE